MEVKRMLFSFSDARGEKLGFTCTVLDAEEETSVISALRSITRTSTRKGIESYSETETRLQIQSGMQNQKPTVGKTFCIPFYLHALQRDLTLARYVVPITRPTPPAYYRGITIHTG